nr:tetratricopeptide repeat protein [uncultured Marinifilum sp.]
MIHVKIKNSAIRLIFLFAINLNLTAQNKNIELYMNNIDYEIVNIDINFDGIMDKVIYSKPYAGNDLLFFQENKGKYIQVLSVGNFSEDGGKIIDTITSVNQDSIIMAIKTLFPDRGTDITTYYIKYCNVNNWVLVYSINQTINGFEDYTKTKIITKMYNSNLNEIFQENNGFILEKPIKQILSFKYWFEENLKDFQKRFSEENNKIINDTLRYKALINKFPISQNTIVDYNNIGYYLENNQLYIESIFVLKKVKEFSPNRTVVYINLGDAYWGLNEMEQAKEAYQKYIQIMKANGNESKIPKRIWDRVKD